MKIIIEGKRLEGKSTLAMLLMHLLRDYPYKLNYKSYTQRQEQTKQKMLEEMNSITNLELLDGFITEERDIEIVDMDLNEVCFNPETEKLRMLLQSIIKERKWK